MDPSMQHLLIQLTAALLSTLGFALFFNTRPRQIPALTIGGLLTWVVYLIVQKYVTTDTFLSTFLASVFAAVYAEGLGVWFRAPASAFFFVTVITLVPGRTLYFTMSSAAVSDWSACASYGLSTLFTIVGIAAGMSAVWAVSSMWRRYGSSMLRRSPLVVKTARAFHHAERTGARVMAEAEEDKVRREVEREMRRFGKR